MRDYPAAHSMDTSWYAIDADGYVARFETGEDGALPTLAAAGPEAGTFDVLPLLAVIVARVLSESAPPREEAELFIPNYPQKAVVVAYPDARDEVFGMLGEDGCEILPNVFVSLRPLSPERLRRLSRDERVKKLAMLDEIYEYFEDNSALFLFRCGDAPGQYIRRNHPSAPIPVDALPEAIASDVSRLSLPVRFADSATLHLAEHLSDADCHIWGERTLRGESTAEPASAPQRSARAPRVIAWYAALLLLLLLAWWLSL